MKLSHTAIYQSNEPFHTKDVFQAMQDILAEIIGVGWPQLQKSWLSIFLRCVGVSNLVQSKQRPWVNNLVHFIIFMNTMHHSNKKAKFVVIWDSISRFATLLEILHEYFFKVPWWEFNGTPTSSGTVTETRSNVIVKMSSMTPGFCVGLRNIYWDGEYWRRSSLLKRSACI